MLDHVSGRRETDRRTDRQTEGWGGGGMQIVRTYY